MFLMIYLSSFCAILLLLQQCRLKKSPTKSLDETNFKMINCVWCSDSFVKTIAAGKDHLGEVTDRQVVISEARKWRRDI